jgi:hypothetical protein
MMTMYKKAGGRIAALLVVVALIASALAAVALSGCGGTTAPTTPTTKPTTPASSGTSPTAVGTPAPPKVFTATGPSTTSLFPLTTGLSLYNILYTGTGSFVAEVLNSSGAGVTQLANVNGPLSGTQSAGLPAGSYSLQVQATGEWTITVSQPQPVVVPFTPQVFAGAGMDVTGFFKSANGGTANVTLTNQGTGSFVVTLLNQRGTTVRVVTSTTGAFNGTVELPLDANINYVFDVESDGTWTIRIE